MENWQKEAWIAEHIMGWRKVGKTEGIYKTDPGTSFLVDSPRNSKTVFVGESYRIYDDAWSIHYRVWRPCSNIRDAWMIAEKMTKGELDDPKDSSWQFYARMGQLNLWTMPEARAAEELCVVAIVAMRYNSETLEKFG